MKSNSWLRRFLGVVCILSVVVIWVSSSELIQVVFNEMTFTKPLFLTFFSTGLFTLYLLGFLICPSWRRQFINEFFGKKEDIVAAKPTIIEQTEEQEALNYQSPATIQENEHSTIMFNGSSTSDESVSSAVDLVPVPEVSSTVQNSEPATITIKSVIKNSIAMCAMWFIANVVFNYALSKTSVASNTIISSSSSLWTFLLGVLLAVDRFSFLRLLTVATTMSGIAVITIFDHNSSSSVADSLIGNGLSLLSAFLYGCYCTFLKWRMPDENSVSMPMFFGFVGLFNLILLWPLLILFHFTGWETFELPSWKLFLFLCVNGLCGTFLSELLWGWAILLTSPIATTIGISLTIPVAILADVVLHNKYQALTAPYLTGTVIVLISFIITNISYLLPDKIKKFDQPECCTFGYWKNLCLKRAQQEELVEGK